MAASRNKPPGKKTASEASAAAKTARPKASAGSGFSAEEKAAMQARARELKAEAKAQKTRAEGERELQAAIKAMPAGDRRIATTVHALVAEAAPDLIPRTWYGMPAWSRAGKVLCFLQVAGKFNNRYATFGFNDSAKLDDGAMWPTAFALASIDAGVEKRLRALLRQALD